MKTYSDYRINIDHGMRGQARATCPECSPYHEKSNDKCLSVNVERGVWHCHRCGWKGCLAGAYHAARYCPVSDCKPDYTRNKMRLENLLGSTFSLNEAGAEPQREYLKSRGLSEILKALPPVLHAHPGLAYHDGAGNKARFYPGLVATVQDPLGRTISAHRTYVASDGRGKAAVDSPKKLFPPAYKGALRGSAIRLYEVDYVLAIAEGIETALAVHLETGYPVWSATSARGMASLVVPRTVKKVLVYADNDRNGVGQQAGRVLSDRMFAEDREVTLIIPRRAGTDWLDFYVQGTTA